MGSSYRLAAAITIPSSSEFLVVRQPPPPSIHCRLPQRTPQIAIVIQGIFHGEVRSELWSTFCIPVGSGVCASQELIRYPCGKCPRRWFGNCLCSQNEQWQPTVDSPRRKCNTRAPASQEVQAAVSRAAVSRAAVQGDANLLQHQRLQRVRPEGVPQAPVPRRARMHGRVAGGAAAARRAGECGRDVQKEEGSGRGQWALSQSIRDLIF